MPEQCKLADYHAFWHWRRRLLRRIAARATRAAATRRSSAIPNSTWRPRIVQVALGDLVLASVYVPNGGKDYEAKLALPDRARGVGETAARRRSRADPVRRHQHRPRRHRRASARSASPASSDSGRRSASSSRRSSASTWSTSAARSTPTMPSLFTWWPPWRNMRQRNIGWRIDYILASRAIAERATSCVVLADVGTSDHAPVMMTTT